MNKSWTELWRKIEKWKYPLLILLVGLLLMLLPASDKQGPTEPGAQEALAELLSRVQGVGEARVLITDSGVVAACTGASSASVRLDMIRAISAYTGFGSDKIMILKLRN